MSFWGNDINDFDDLNKYPLILQKAKSNSRKLLNHIALENNVQLITKIEAVIEYLKDNNVYDYELCNHLYPGMWEPDLNIVEYAEDVLYMINLLINNK